MRRSIDSRGFNHYLAHEVDHSDAELRRRATLNVCALAAGRNPRLSPHEIYEVLQTLGLDPREYVTRRHVTLDSEVDDRCN